MTVIITKMLTVIQTILPLTVNNAVFMTAKFGKVAVMTLFGNYDTSLEFHIDGNGIRSNERDDDDV